jgi:hypothetical protein
LAVASDHEAYIVEKLGEAVDALVADAGPVRERLYNASTHLLRIAPEQIADDELRSDFQWIKNSLTSASPEGREGTVIATLRVISDEHASAVARRILELWRELYDRMI